jgi:single-strand DNA-binding protein
MASVNKAIILGNLGRDPELRHTPGGKAVATLRIATNEVWTDQSGERQERTEWHTVVVWGRQAENCNQYLKKGRTVYIEGRLTTRKWQDKEGKDRYSTEIVADRVQFIGGGTGGGGGGGGREFEDQSLEPPPPGGNDDIPF